MEYRNSWNVHIVTQTGKLKLVSLELNFIVRKKISTKTSPCKKTEKTKKLQSQIHGYLAHLNRACVNCTGWSVLNPDTQAFR